MRALATDVVAACASAGVREFIVCAGARNAALVSALVEGGYPVRNFFDERSAAFFANLLALFFGNEEETNRLASEIGEVDSYGGRLIPVQGVMHSAQPRAVLAPMEAAVHALDPFALAAFHDLVSLSGSLVIGFAALRDHRDAPSLWALSRIDEIWQAELWGADEEAEEMAAKKESDFLHAKRFYDLSRGRN